MANTLLNIETMLGSVSRLGATAPVTIGSVTLTGMEVPSGVTFGGQQQITIHRLPGGDRVIDLGGNDPNRIEMEGIFLGPSAQTRTVPGEDTARRAAGEAPGRRHVHSGLCAGLSLLLRGKRRDLPLFPRARASR